jgi:hypothetical protein
MSDHEDDVRLGYLAAGAAAEAYSVYQATGDPEAAGKAAGKYLVYSLPLVAFGFLAVFCGFFALLSVVAVDSGLMLGLGIVSALAWWAFAAMWRSYRRSIARLTAPQLPPPIPSSRVR